MDGKYLRYEDFGAVGDGVTDDLPAIVACHEEANRTGTPVKATDGARYYISNKKMTAYIKTDVDFGSAEFIIDDRDLEDIHFDVFVVDSDYEGFRPDIKELSAGQKKLGLSHEGNLYVRVFNENHKIFIREGLNMNAGTPVTDCFILDTEGNISPSVDWDYPVITDAYARRIDDKPITISGGIFTSIANIQESFYNYHWHGICIRRANVTLSGLRHYVTGEGEHGAPYRSFIYMKETANVTVKDCLLTPHLIYYTESKVPGKPVAMGSYDINSHASVNVSFINVRQSIDMNDVRYWGIFTSNFSKNLYLEGCELSRVDAHQGVTNITVKNCVFGHEGLLLIGCGEAYIENTEVRACTFFHLRPDYGAVWNGNVTVKNCYWNFREQAYHTPSSKNRTAFVWGNNGTHNFGYICRAPKTINIDGLRINDTSFGETPVRLMAEYQRTDDVERNFKYLPPEKVVIKNITTDSGRPYELYEREELYADTEFIKE